MLSKFTIIIGIVALLVVNIAYAQNYESFARIVGVDNEGKGIIGNVSVEIQPGKGRVLVDTTPLQGIHTQNSEKTAVKVAEKITNFNFDDHDVIYSIATPNAHVVDGPSAGVMMTIATISAVDERPISSGIAMTGTIQEDGSIGAVGEILTKAKISADSGMAVFLIPEGQGIQNQYIKKIRTPAPGWYIQTIEPVSVNVVEYAKENWDLDVHEVGNIEDAMKYAFNQSIIAKIPITAYIEDNVSLPEFGSPVQSYNEFSVLTEEEMIEAQKRYFSVKNRLDRSLLPETEKTSLENVLTMAKEYLDKSKLLKENGYTYSSGNFAFKSIINCNFISDMLDYYSTPSKQRTEFLNEKLLDAKKEARETKNSIIPNTDYGICNSENFEWAVGARQRIIYAEIKLNSIQILPDEKSLDPEYILFNINTANEWIKISKNFMLMSSRASMVKQNCTGDFENQAEKIILDAENQIYISGSFGIETPDAEWYLNAAKKEFSEGLYITAIYDATNAKIRSSTASKYESKTLNEIYADFNSTQFITKDLFGTIYLEHSHFTMYEAIKEDSKQGALEAISSLVLAEQTNENYLEIKKKMNKVFVFDYKLLQNYTWVLIGVIFVVGFYSVHLKSKIIKIERKYKKLLISQDSIRVKKIEVDIKKSVEKELEKRLKAGKISKIEYERLKRKLL